MAQLTGKDLASIARYQKWMRRLYNSTGLISITPDYFQVKAEEVESLAPLIHWEKITRTGKHIHIRYWLTKDTYICSLVEALDGELYERCVRQMEGQEPQVDAPVA